MRLTWRDFGSHPLPLPSPSAHACMPARSPPAGIEATLLYATNEKVDALNFTKLRALPGEEVVYDACDEGSEPHLTQVLACLIGRRWFVGGGGDGGRERGLVEIYYIRICIHTIHCLQPQHQNS